MGFSPDSRNLIIARSQKDYKYTVKILDLNGRAVRSYVDINFGSFSVDGRYFLARDYREETGKEQKLFAPSES